MQRATSLLRTAPRAFTSRPALSTRAYSLSKLTLIGNLVADPEVRTTRNDKEFVAYTVATTNYPLPPPNPDGTRPDKTSTFHKIFSFNESANNYLKTIRKGALVYAEASFEMHKNRETGENGEAVGHPQPQIFCRHETLRVLKHAPRPENDESM